VETDDDGNARLLLSGDWVQGEQQPPLFADLARDLRRAAPDRLLLDGSALGSWDTVLMAYLLRVHNYCEQYGIALDNSQLPAGAVSLLEVATAVKTHVPPPRPARSIWSAINPAGLLRAGAANTREFLAFIGEFSVAMVKLVSGRANTRRVDFLTFFFQAGPDALAIISLTSILVGMILGYLGAVQLQQFGAEIYVADLVTIGSLREMGALMTAVVMAGRTGAAYAAQLGTMQTNEEIDAISTLGMSPMEFLVVPRILALVLAMPLLTIYADVLGILGGGIVAAGMGISPIQYINEAATVVTLTHVNVGLFKSVVFGILIAIAGCRAGMQSGRSSAAVGQAATSAVVTAVVYLIVADAAINILCQRLDI
jgi:phospholipid/cholesterol/gamma-HCH transport system permease protein